MVVTGARSFDGITREEVIKMLTELKDRYERFGASAYDENDVAAYAAHTHAASAYDFSLKLITSME